MLELCLTGTAICAFVCTAGLIDRFLTRNHNWEDQ